MKITFFSVLFYCAVIPSVLVGQNNVCSFNAEKLPDNYYKYIQGNYEKDLIIENVINEVVSIIGLEKNFVYINSPGLNNCAALNYDAFRIILYDKNFLKDLSNNKTEKKSVFVSILAHEIGHHLQGHIIKNISNDDNKLEELEADKFSGYVMAKLGYSLSEAKEAITGISDNISETHPRKSQRLSAIDSGYKTAKLQIENDAIKVENTLYLKFFMTGQENYRKQLYDQASENFTTAISLNHTSNFFPLSMRAITYSAGKNYNLALRDFDQLEKISVADNIILADYLHYNKGVTLEKMGEYSKAASSFYNAFTMNSADKLALMRFAMNQSMSGNHQSALMAFELQLNDDDIYNSDLQDYSKGNVFYQRAISYYESNENANALKYFSIAERLFPYNYPKCSLLYYYKGKIYERGKDFKTAKLYLTKSCNLNLEIACENMINDEAISEIFGGYKTQLIEEYKYNYSTLNYDLITELNVKSELFFDLKGYSFKRGDNEWRGTTWTYLGFDKKSNSHLYQDGVKQLIAFDKEYTTISWYLTEQNGIHEKKITYKKLQKDETVFPD